MSNKRKRQSDIQTKERVTRPRKYKVIMLNDDYTPMEFVIRILEDIFHKSSAEATRLMLTVHRQGASVIGTYSREIAITKRDKSIRFARENGFPLVLEVEPED